jgi:hypothetical protein
MAAPSQLADPLPVQALGLQAGMSFDAWVRAGRRIERVANATTWARGDWLVFGERTYGPRYKEALRTIPLDYQTLRNYAWVARRFPPQRRHPELSFQHHAELASLPEAEQELWLGRASRLGWSRNDLRAKLAAHRRKLRHETTASAVSMSVLVPAERQERWRRAAELADKALPEWMIEVADAAADAAIGRGYEQESRD